MSNQFYWASSLLMLCSCSILAETENLSDGVGHPSTQYMWQVIDLNISELQKSKLTDVQFVATQNGFQHGWISSSQGNVAHTQDAGQTWQLSTQNISKIEALHFIDEQTGWAVGHKIWRSQDAGMTWAEQNLPSEINDAGVADIHFVDHQQGMALLTSTQLLITEDGGNNWFVREQNTTPNAPLSTSALYMQDAQTVWVANWAGRTGLEFSADAGLNWQLQATDPVYYLVDVGFDTPEHGWAVGYHFSQDGSCANESGFLSYVFTTNNKGQKWNNIGNFCGYPQTGDFANAEQGWMLGDKVIWKSDNGGIDWQSEYKGEQGLAIDMLTPHNGWVVGEAGLVLNYQAVSIPNTTAEVITEAAKTQNTNCRTQYDAQTRILTIPCIDVINPTLSTPYQGVLQWKTASDPFEPIQFILLEAKPID